MTQDKQIVAKNLKEGDMLHLTFMGGDDYVEITKVRKIGPFVYWEGSSIVSSHSDRVMDNQVMRIKA